jgi:hypothetical protein
MKRHDGEVAQSRVIEVLPIADFGHVSFSRGLRRTERTPPVAWGGPFELDRAPECGTEVVMYVM